MSATWLITVLNFQNILTASKKIFTEFIYNFISCRMQIKNAMYALVISMKRQMPMSFLFIF